MKATGKKNSMVKGERLNESYSERWQVRWQTYNKEETTGKRDRIFYPFFVLQI